MARIPEAAIEQLKAEVSVARLVEASGIALARRGKDLAGRCPFHDDHEPSLVVTPDKNLWHCFSCSVGGGPIDWIMRRNGVSFRHAVELLREGLPAVTESTVKRTTVRVLPTPVVFDADDQVLLNQTVEFYHRTLRQAPEALAYLKARGLDHPELVEIFKLGFANRTLGLRLPDKRRKEGAELRARLERLGLYRESGHEHFNGSLVVPVFDAHGAVTEIYGRKINDNLRPGTPLHLYLPGPHQGVWNLAGVAASGGEVILCEALLDAMTFWCAGYRNVTAAYGVEGLTEDHRDAFRRHGVRRVLIAFDRDEAGERGAAKVAELLMTDGIACFRIQFPKGLDANAYAVKVTPPAKSLGLLIRKAAWLGRGAAPAAPTTAMLPVSERSTDAVTDARVSERSEPESPRASERDAPTLALLSERTTDTATDAPLSERTPLPSAAMVEAASPMPAGAAPEPATEIGTDGLVLRFGPRRYRVRGFEKNLAVDVMRVNVLAGTDDAFHVDTFDLYSAKQRGSFVQQAAAELGERPEVVKADLGQVLLRLEAMQDTRIQETLDTAPAEPEIAEAERMAALALLRAPDLLDRILADFDACGLIGEATGKLTAYLAAVSRKLDRPLAVLVQSSSAAGKSSLMDAVLAFVPEEDRVKYSAMTGQSLFYMGETSLRHRILAIAEEEGVARAAYALKLLQSDGELTIASTGKDEAGNLVTQEYRVEGPVMIFLTTTAIDIDEELLNRCLVLSVDEGRGQTEAIHRLQREKRTLAGLVRRHERQALLQLHRNAQRLLRPLAVVNPYADRLTFLADKTRARRDHEKYLSLIDAIALLHQHQRPIRRLELGGQEIEYVEATLDDIAAANRLTHEVLGRSLDELPPQTRRLLSIVAGLVAERAATRAVARADIRFSRKELRDAIGWGDTQLKIHLARLVELEHLLPHRADRGAGGFVYELLYDGDGTAAPHLSGLIETDSLMGACPPAALADRGDAARSGLEDERSGSGRASVGPRAGSGQAPRSTKTPGALRGVADTAVDAPESHVLPAPQPATPYMQPAAPHPSQGRAALSG